jgi:hypothetical protein
LVVAMPVMDESVGSVREELLRSKPVTPAIQKIRNFLAWFLVIATVAIVAVNFYGAFVGDRSSYYPREAVRVLSDYSKDNKVVLFNDYGWGGYLEMEAPGIKVFIDGRMPHWVDKNGNSAMKDYVKLFYSNNRGSVDEVIKKWNINTVLIGNSPEKRNQDAIKNSVTNKIALLLERTGTLGYFRQKLNSENNNENLRKILINEGWRILYQDRVAVLLVK